MILKALREKSNQKFLNSLLEKRTNRFNKNKVKSIGVILNQAEFNDKEAFTTFFKDLNISSPKNKVIFYQDLEGIDRASWEYFFTNKDFGWSGQIKNMDLQQFIDEPFDVLIAYYDKDIPQIHQVVAMSKAGFKVGIHNHDQRLFDLILELSVIRFDLFKKEFSKYLKILNKI